MTGAPEKWAPHISGALAIFLALGLPLSPRPSERDGLFYSERKLMDLGAFYLNSSVLQTSPNLGTVVFFFFDNPEFVNPE